MKKSLIIFVIFILTLFFFMQCNTPSSSSGGGGSGNSDDTGETSFKKTVDSAGNIGRFTSVAVDGSDVYISYYDHTNGDLMFIKSTDEGNIWRASNKYVIDSAGDVGEYTSIAVDAFSNVYISYYDYTNGDLKFARSTDGGNNWYSSNIKTVDSSVNVGKSTSIAADGSNVYISYYNYTTGELKFAKSTDGGNTWNPGNIKIVDSVGDVGEYVSLAVDGSDVYISYYDYTNGDLKFAKSTDGGNNWYSSNIKTVDSVRDAGMFTSIAVDGSNVYISYYDYTFGDLKFAKSIDGGNTWDAGNIKIVDSVWDVGCYTSIATDGSNVYISYYYVTNGDLKFAKSIDNGDTW